MWHRRINRNIVECKDNIGSIKNNPCPVLIETLWNVKFKACFVLSKFPLVLIETLWNVKDYRLKRILDTQKVLIETLWNVKIELTDLHLVDRFVLIETLWNVKNYEGLTGGEK